MEFEVNGAERVQGAVGADLGGADGALEDAGDLGEGEFLETAEEEDLAFVAVEPGEGGVDQRVVVADGGVVGGVGAVVGVVLEIGGVGGVRGGVGLAEMVGGAAAGEVIHPGGEAALVAVGVAVFEHPLEDHLRDVLGGGAVAGEFGEKPEERPVVALEQLAQGVEFAAADGEHELMIGSGGGGVHGGDGSVEAGINRGPGRIDRNFGSEGEHGRNGGAAAWRELPGKTRRGRRGYRKFFPGGIASAGRAVLLPA